MTDQQQRPDPGNGYTSADLRSRLSSGVLRLSRRRRMLAILPLVVALVSWFVVPSFAAYTTPAGRSVGISQGNRCIYVGGSCFHAYSNPNTLAFGYFTLTGGGPAVNGYCLDAMKAHIPGEQMAEGGPVTPTQAAYVIATHFPAANGYPGEMGDHSYEAAAVQLAVWSFTDNALARDPGGTWPAGVIARAHAIHNAAVANTEAWTDANGQVTMTLTHSPAAMTGTAPVTFTATVKNGNGKPFHDADATVAFTATNGTITDGAKHHLTAAGVATVAVTHAGAAGSTTTVHATLDGADITTAKTLNPTGPAAQRIGFPRIEKKHAEAADHIAPTPMKTTPSTSTPSTSTPSTSTPTPKTPTVTTTVSAQTSNVGDKIHDTVAVSNATGYEGTVTVKLYGPSATAPNAQSCTGTPASTSTVAVHGNGSYVTPDFTVAQAGYYTYQETLPAGSGYNAVTTPCAEVTETNLTSSKPNTPTVTTTVSAQTSNVGDKIHDTVAVSNATGYEGTVTVNLYGPSATAPTGQSCTGTPASTGTVAVHGNGSYTTPAFTVAQAGYYTYQETLPAGSGYNAVTTPCAETTETNLTSSPTAPQVTTAVSNQNANVGDSIHDSVVVSNSNGYQGTVTVNLYGPFPTAPSADSCTTASPVWTGTVQVNGDKTYTTGAYTITQPGAYTYVETLPGDTTHTGTTGVCGENSETTVTPSPSTPAPAPVGGVQALTTGPPLTGISTPETGVGSGLLRTVIIGLCLMASGMVVVTGLRRNPHAI